MAETFQIPRKIVIFSLVLPVAAALGYALADPEAFTSLGFIGLLLMALSFPVFLKWHHPLLIISWNTTINLYFLPGRPELWIIMVAISLGITVLNRAMGKEISGQYLPSLVWPLAFIALVIVITAKFTGGIGIRSLGGSTFGGRNYILILMAILGYFALSSQRIDLRLTGPYSTMFFLSTITAVVSNLAWFAGPAFYFLYYLFPSNFAYDQAYSDLSVVGEAMGRLTGLAFAAPAISYVLLLRYGLRGLMDPSKLWRLVLFLALTYLSTLGGFRSTVIMTGLLIILLFFLEGLLRTRLALVALLVLVLGGATLIPFARYLPLPVQRSLSILPLDLDSRATFAAQVSTDWRLRMWQILLPQVPQYFWFGKGYGFDPTDSYLLQESILRYGLAFEPDLTIVTGSYHNGPLTLIVPLGIWGLLGFLWFAAAALRILYRNYAYSPPELQGINTFIFAYFIMRLFYFLFLYGQFFQDFAIFTGITGLSVSLNGGVCKAPEPYAQPVTETAVPALSPA